MGTEYYRFHCSFIGDVFPVHPSYPVRAAKPSPAKRFAVAALTAVPNPKYRIYDGGGTIYDISVYIPLFQDLPTQDQIQGKTLNQRRCRHQWGLWGSGVGGPSSAPRRPAEIFMISVDMHMRRDSFLQSMVVSMTHSCRKVTHYDDLQNERLNANTP